MGTVKYDLEEITKQITTVAGTGSVALPTGLAEIAKQIVCTPATASTMFTFQLLNTNDSDSVVFERDADGVLNEIEDIPLYGEYKAKITGATANELFKIRILHI